MTKGEEDNFISILSRLHIWSLSFVNPQTAASKREIFSPSSTSRGLEKWIPAFPISIHEIVFSRCPQSGTQMQQDIARMVNDLQSHHSLRSQFQCELILWRLCCSVKSEVKKCIDTLTHFFRQENLKGSFPKKILAPKPHILDSTGMWWSSFWSKGPKNT